MGGLARRNAGARDVYACGVPRAVRRADRGGRECQEYWIPAEELPEFDASIVEPIEVVAEFHCARGGEAPETRG
jgi:hypothetical protein